METFCYFCTRIPPHPTSMSKHYPTEKSDATPYIYRYMVVLLLTLSLNAWGQRAKLLIVELNTENLFDTDHDSLKADLDFTPDGTYRWTRSRYWRKLNRTAQTLLACGTTDSTAVLPDLIGLCEVENDSVLIALTRRSLLRKARYDYVMTASPDRRGIDVALVYQPFSFSLISSTAFRIPPRMGLRPTRDILYAKGRVEGGDTLHVFVVHAPSRAGGEVVSRPNRLHVAHCLAEKIDSITATAPEARIVVMGDFNDHHDDASLQLLYRHGLTNASRLATGRHGARGTYRFRGEWGSLDHILVSLPLQQRVNDCHIHDAEFLLEEDKTYGGVKPRRNYIGPHYNDGFSDHLPLVLTLTL